MPLHSSLELLKSEVVACRRCPRLVQYREAIQAKGAFASDSYWRLPVPGFGDPNAWLLITGLAPSAHGGNRTGRIFTGDKSGVFLMNGLFEAGLANQPVSTGRDDGLELKGCYMSAVVKCVPPRDKPSAEECRNCLPYYQEELHLLKRLTHVLVLGRMAFDGFLRATDARKRTKQVLHFAHGVRYAIAGLPVLYASYHPSPQNTNTGLLTQEMFRELCQTIINDRGLS